MKDILSSALFSWITNIELYQNNAEEGIDERDLAALLTRFGRKSANSF